MEQLILHAIGDYVTQNSWLANNKTKFTIEGWVACFLHSVFYSLPFLLIGSYQAVFVIWITHFFIDKFRLAQYYIRLYNWEWHSNNFGFPAATPVWLSTWLLFIIDNIFHITINFLAIKFL